MGHQSVLSMMLQSHNLMRSDLLIEEDRCRKDAVCSPELLCSRELSVLTEMSEKIQYSSYEPHVATEHSKCVELHFQFHGSI